MTVNLNINKHNNITPTNTTKIKESQTNTCRFTCLLTCRTPHYKTWRRLPSDVHGWLCYRVPERITYKVAILTYRALTGDLPQYLRQFVRVADVPSRHRLRSSTSDDLIVPAVRLTSTGSCAFFPVTGARIWNTLPLHVTSASSLTAFKQHLKLHLFCFSFPGLSPSTPS